MQYILRKIILFLFCERAYTYITIGTKKKKKKMPIVLFPSKRLKKKLKGREYCWKAAPVLFFSFLSLSLCRSIQMLSRTPVWEVMSVNRPSGFDKTYWIFRTIWGKWKNSPVIQEGKEKPDCHPGRIGGKTRQHPSTGSEEIKKLDSIQTQEGRKVKN